MLFADSDSKVGAVKAHAKEHYEEDGWDIVIETMTNSDIYNVVKHTRSDKAAIKKMANHVAAPAAYRAEVIAEGGTERTDLSW